MTTSPRTVRWTSLGLFLLLTLPLLTILSLGVKWLALLWFVDTTVRAIPLYLAICFDGWFYDGGELSPAMIPVWVGLTGLLLWPLLALGIRPAAWASHRWRRTIVSYAVVAVLCTVPAAWWMFTHTGYLF
ncbi:MAG: hypothetical protein HUU46_17660 [Candidatus Hydrogenedentes bacterium]|nr:hypothetical protein [Candidatus Hydrogenedentota bacterium]